MREEDFGSGVCGSVRFYDGLGGVRGCMVFWFRFGSGVWFVRSVRDSWVCRRVKVRVFVWVARE